MSAEFGAALAGYVEVSERLVQFYAAWPDGRVICSPPELVRTPVGDRVAVTAYVYRDAHDLAHHLPAGVASSWELLPGSTPYTKNSEAENAETSAIGRALVAAGVPSKRGLASADELRAKTASAGVPRAVAKGQLLAACAGHADIAADWWHLAGFEHVDTVPTDALAVLVTICAGTHATDTPAEAPQDGPPADTGTTTPEPTREELVARARADVAAAAAAHNEGEPTP